MPLLRQRVTGALTHRKPVKLPPADPSSLDILLTAIGRRIAGGPIGRFIRHAVERHPYVVGAHGFECAIHPTAHVGNAILNATSGRIVIDEYVSFGHGVSILAGTHDVQKRDLARQTTIPSDGYGVHIERGAWIATNAVVIGPSRIGAHAVVASGAVVVGDVPAGAVVGGVPARVLRMLED